MNTPDLGSPFVLTDDEGPYVVCTAWQIDASGVGRPCDGRQRWDADAGAWVCPDCGETTRVSDDA